MKLRSGISILIVLICTPEVGSQSVSKSLIIETRVHAGINLPFYDAVSYMMKDEIYAFDVSAGVPSQGNS